MSKVQDRPLPKFGEWDVNDPATAEGFTVIFNRARDEKKTNGAESWKSASHRRSEKKQSVGKEVVLLRLKLGSEVLVLQKVAPVLFCEEHLKKTLVKCFDLFQVAASSIQAHDNDDEDIQASV